MTVVKHLANEGLTICATIHSPSPTAFELFDRMLLLLSGQVAYFGFRGAHCMVHCAIVIAVAFPLQAYTSALQNQQCCMLAGGPAIEYFGSLPAGFTDVGPQHKASSEADWIVQITTTAHRQAK